MTLCISRSDLRCEDAGCPHILIEEQGNQSVEFLMEKHEGKLIPELNRNNTLFEPHRSECDHLFFLSFSLIFRGVVCFYWDGICNVLEQMC